MSSADRELARLDWNRVKLYVWPVVDATLDEFDRLITMNDIYSFDPDARVNLDDFVDIVGRNFRQPKEGLGLDNSPSSHMWRTLMWPTRFL